LANEIVDESFTLKLIAWASLKPRWLHVENLLGTDLADARFVLHRVTGAADGDRRISVGARGRVDQKRVTLGVVLAILEMFRDMDESAIGRPAGADRDRFGYDVRVVSSAA